MTDVYKQETDKLQTASAQEMVAVTGGDHHVLLAMMIAKMYAAKPSIFELKPFGGGQN